VHGDSPCLHRPGLTPIRSCCSQLSVPSQPERLKHWSRSLFWLNPVPITTTSKTFLTRSTAMKSKSITVFIAVLGTASALLAQGSPETRTVHSPNKIEKRVIVRGGMGIGGEMGKWWRDQEISKKLQLSDGQIGQLDQIFYDHRVKLID